MTAKTEKIGAPPQTPAGAIYVAFVDADDSLRDQIGPVLQEAGFQPVWLNLADFRSGYAALAALFQQQASVIVYELGERHQRDPNRFEDFYAVTHAQERPLIISTLSRWLEEERMLRQSATTTTVESEAITRLLTAIRRTLAQTRRAA